MTGEPYCYIFVPEMVYRRVQVSYCASMNDCIADNLSVYHIDTTVMVIDEIEDSVLVYIVIEPTSFDRLAWQGFITRHRENCVSVKSCKSCTLGVYLCIQACPLSMCLLSFCHRSTVLKFIRYRLSTHIHSPLSTYPVMTRV